MYRNESREDTPRLDEAVGPQRIHYMDNLRALAMLAGIVFHAALAYSPMLHNLWLSADPQTSPVIDAVAWFTHLFRMPLFFLIAGFFCQLLVEKRGPASMARNRALRVVLPLALFLPLMWIAFGASIGWAIENVENLSPILQMVAWAAQMPEPPPPPPATTTHLWFLYYLAQFYVAYLILRVLFRQRWAAPLARLVNVPVLVFVLPLAIAPALYSQVTPHPAPEQFTPHLWAYGLFGLFFAVGTQLFRQQDLVDRLRPYAPWMLGSSVVLYALIFTEFPRALTLADAMQTALGGPGTLRHGLVAVGEAFVAVHMTLVCLVVGKAWLDRASKAVRFIADASYWLYLVHLPVVFAIQYLLLDVDLNLWLELTISIVGTFAIGLVSYVLLVRWTPIGWMLNGRRRARKPSTRSDASEVATPNSIA